MVIDDLLWKIRDEFNPECTDCRMCQYVDGRGVCEVGTGSANPDHTQVMVVSKMPNSEQYRDLIEETLQSVGIDPYKVYYTAAIKCRTFEKDPSSTDIKACRKYLEAEIAFVQPKWVLALGNEALLATTGHSGITKYRAKVIDKGNYKVVPTISPAMVMRNPGQREAWLADLSFFSAQVRGKTSKVQPPGILYVDTRKKFDQLKKILSKSEVIAYDVETNGISEFAPSAAIVSLAGTCRLKSGKVICWAIPLSHPQSVFRSTWRRVLEKLKPYLEPIKKQVAHNGKFDARWLRHFGVDVKVTYDTMLACHLLDENRLKGLKPQATARFGVADWSIDTRALVASPIRDVLKYNALDTFYTYQIYLETRQELIEQPRLLRIFQLITMPTLELLIEAERRGIWVDRERLATNTKVAFDMRDELDKQLRSYLPKPGKKKWPVDARGRAREINWNPSIFARWFWFRYLGLPVTARGKEKPNGAPGDPSMAEAIMTGLKGKHPAIDLHLERTKWQKYCSSFLVNYSELADENDRIHTTYKPAGTVTGRLSSGKEDADKLTAQRNIRGVNIQQVPRDIFIRGLFGSAPGYTFVEADFNQVELRIVTHISKDPNMTRLYQTGEDIHLATAMNVLGFPASQITKELRKKAKAVNFGFCYGMGWKKFIYTAWEKYELVFSEVEARQTRRLFFEQFPGLLPWHARQRRLVAEHGRVQSPIGRIRHLPDIHSSDPGVRAEAERQAINSPVQSFGSDLTQLSMLLVTEAFKEHRIEGYVIGTVHDSLLFEVKNKHVGKALPVIKDTMETLPLERKFGMMMTVPIVVDLKVGRHWGDARELEADEVYNWNGNIAH
jgi:uracil-DNA glycosylase family 4